LKATIAFVAKLVLVTEDVKHRDDKVHVAGLVGSVVDIVDVDEGGRGGDLESIGHVVYMALVWMDPIAVVVVFEGERVVAGRNADFVARPICGLRGDVPEVGAGTPDPF